MQDLRDLIMTNNICVEYWNFNDASGTKVLRRVNKNGTLVSAKKYSEVLFFKSYEEAVPILKEIISRQGMDAKIRYCHEASEDYFYLS